MSTELLQPFQLNTNGGLGVTTSSTTQINQHLESLIGTNPGERVMLPRYGIGTGHMLFSTNSPQNRAMWLQQIRSALSTWEPNVNIQSVNLQGDASVNDPETSTFQVDIDWLPASPGSASATGVETCTVLVGGTVIQDAVTP